MPGLFRTHTFLPVHKEKYLIPNFVCRQTQSSGGRPTEIVNADVVHEVQETIRAHLRL